MRVENRNISVRNQAVRLPDADPRLLDLLPGASFADSYRWRCSSESREASFWLDRVLGKPPKWVDKLMVLRNRIGAWIGLTEASVDGFPVLSRSPDRIVVGMDDWHLDFRIICLCDPDTDGTRLVTMGTVVRPHNLTGRVYLAVVMPFHRLISHTLITRASAQCPSEIDRTPS